MHPNDEDGMANSVDPDQTDLGLYCLPFCQTEDHYGMSVRNMNTVSA